MVPMSNYKAKGGQSAVFTHLSHPMCFTVSCRHICLHTNSDCYIVCSLGNGNLADVLPTVDERKSGHSINFRDMAICLISSDTKHECYDALSKLKGNK